MNRLTYNERIRYLVKRIGINTKELSKLQDFVCLTSDNSKPTHDFTDDLYGKYCVHCGYVSLKHGDTECVMCGTTKELTTMDHRKGKVTVCSSCKLNTVKVTA